MKSFIKLTLLLAVTATTIYSCKKNTNTSPAGSIAGNYSVNDTAILYLAPPQCPNGGAKATHYSTAIVKVSDNTVYLVAFQGCPDTIVANVTYGITNLSIVATNAGSCLTSLTGTVAGNNIYFSYVGGPGMSCDSAGRAMAVKQ